MYANLQFQDKALDLKYKPTFLIVLSQIKLMIAGLATFFQQEDDIIVQLILIGSSMLVISFYSFKNQPCLITQANMWHTAGYGSIAWVINKTSNYHSLDYDWSYFR
jgi:hypothetical protein